MLISENLIDTSGNPYPDCETAFSQYPIDYGNPITCDTGVGVGMGGDYMYNMCPEQCKPECGANTGTY